MCAFFDENYLNTIPLINSFLLTYCTDRHWIVNLSKICIGNINCQFNSNIPSTARPILVFLRFPNDALKLFQPGSHGAVSNVL